MAHIDAAILIAICIVNFKELYTPLIIDPIDIYNIKGKVKILVDGAC